jgi:multicomponent Na+:H+ antiporter subunit E
MRVFYKALALAIVWMFMTATFTPTNLVVGFALAYAILWIGQEPGPEARALRKLPRLVIFVGFYLWKLILASLRVAWDVVTPRHHMKPGVIAVPLEAKTDLEITLLASLISLTPGTLTLDVSEDRSELYVHAMYLDDPDALRREIKQDLERRVLEFMR